MKLRPDSCAASCPSNTLSLLVHADLRNKKTKKPRTQIVILVRVTMNTTVDAKLWEGGLRFVESSSRRGVSSVPTSNRSQPARPAINLLHLRFPLPALSSRSAIASHACCSQHVSHDRGRRQSRRSLPALSVSDLPQAIHSTGPSVRAAFHSRWLVCCSLLSSSSLSVPVQQLNPLISARVRARKTSSDTPLSTSRPRRASASSVSSVRLRSDARTFASDTSRPSMPTSPRSPRSPAPADRELLELQSRKRGILLLLPRPREVIRPLQPLPLLLLLLLLLPLCRLPSTRRLLPSSISMDQMGLGILICLVGWARRLEWVSARISGAQSQYVPLSSSPLPPAEVWTERRFSSLFLQERSTPRSPRLDSASRIHLPCHIFRRRQLVAGPKNLLARWTVELSKVCFDVPCRDFRYSR